MVKLYYLYTSVKNAQKLENEQKILEVSDKYVIILEIDDTFYGASFSGY